MTRPSFFATSTHRVALALLAGLGSLAWSLPVQAQSEYRMDEAGNWVRVAAPEEGTDAAVIAKARTALAEDRPEDAHAILDDWLLVHESSRSPYLPEALLLRGDALTATGHEYDALYDYERVIKEFPASKDYPLAVERELDIGTRYVNGLNRKFFGMRILPADDAGEELLIRVQERMPGSEMAERGGIELSDYYYRERELSLAAEAYELFVENYPNSRYVMKARERRIYSVIGQYKGPRYDGSSLRDAKVLVKRFASLYPAEAQASGLDEALVVRLDESEAEEMYESAMWYAARDDDVSERYVFRRLIREHPRSAAADRAMAIMKTKGWPIVDPRIQERRDRIKREKAKEKTGEAPPVELPDTAPPPPKVIRRPPPPPPQPVTPVTPISNPVVNPDASPSVPATAPGTQPTGGQP